MKKSHLWQFGVIAAISVAFTAAAPAQSPNGMSGRTPNRTPVELRQAVDAALAAEAKATSSDARVAAIRKLVELSKATAAHPTFAKGAAAKLRSRIATRLVAVQKEIRDQARHSREAEPRDQPVSRQSLGTRDELHAQVPGGPAGGNVVAADGAEVLADLIQDVVEPGAWERNGGAGAIGVFAQGARQQPEILAQVPGGPANGKNGPGNAPLALTENVGDELVALIEEVIAPETWEARGGQGVAVFWPNQNLLIIRQTEEVHEAIFDVVGRMRRE